MNKFLRAISQYISFEGDEDGKGGDGKDGDGNKNEEEKKFTQTNMNTVVAEEKRRNMATAKVREQKILGELQELKKTASLTAEEKDSLEKRIEDLQTANMTNEEKARRAEEIAEKKTSEQVDVLTKERDNWQSKHSDLVINSAIITAASEGERKALFNEQILAILKPKTKLAEMLDDDGKPTGNSEPKVSFPDLDKEDNPITLELTVPEAIKRMKELEKYGNLFDGDKKGGLGGTGSQSASGKLDLAKIAKEDPARYREERAKRLSKK